MAKVNPLFSNSVLRMGVSRSRMSRFSEDAVGRRRSLKDSASPGRARGDERWEKWGRGGASLAVRPRAEPAGTRWEKWGGGGASKTVRPRAEPAGTRDGRCGVEAEPHWQCVPGQSPRGRGGRSGVEAEPHLQCVPGQSLRGREMAER
jgi:hypothetical protein